VEYENMLNGNVGTFIRGFTEMEKVNQDMVIVAHVPNPRIKGAPTFFCNSVCFYQTRCAPEAIFMQDYELENLYDLRDSFLKLKEHDRKIPLPDSEERVLCNLHEISKVEYLWYLSQVQLVETLGILQHKFYMQSTGVFGRNPKWACWHGYQAMQRKTPS
jgi:hypothetical protein